MRCDKLPDRSHERSNKVERHQTALIAGSAAPRLAPHLAAILSRAGDLLHLDNPNPDLPEIPLAGRGAAFAAGQQQLAVEVRAFSQTRPALPPARSSRPALAVWTDIVAPQGEHEPVSAPLPSIEKVVDTKPSASRVVRGGLSRWQQRQALSLMTRIDLGPLKISDVSSACRLSRSYFVKAFKQSFGLTPRRWYQVHRIEQSKQLLLSNDLSIAEIALTCGFADQSHFTRVFCQIVGTPPARWRRQSCE